MSQTRLTNVGLKVDLSNLSRAKYRQIGTDTEGTLNEFLEEILCKRKKT